MNAAGLLRSTAVFSAMTFLSRVSGLLRDQVYAAVIGVNPAMDAFVVAFRIPDFMRRLSAEGSFCLAFVPVLAGQLAPCIVRACGPGGGAVTEQGRLAADLLRSIDPHALSISMGSLAGGILNTIRRFAVPAVTPVLMNVTTLAAALGCSRFF